MASFTNQATLSYNGNVTNSNITTGELLDVLSATKTAVMDDYTANDDVTYVVSIVNSGSSAFNGLTLTDNLGEYTFGKSTLVPLDYNAGSINYYINGALQAAPTVSAGPPLVVSGINVPANGNATIIYETTVNEYAPLAADSTITNTVTVTGEGIPNNVTATETINTEDVANLSISKSMCPTSVSENGNISYTFVIQNSGNTAASDSDNVVLTDTFNPILNPITVTLNGDAFTDYTYSTSTGLFETTAGAITVPAATYTQDTTNGNWVTTPGVSVLVVTGTV